MRIGIIGAGTWGTALANAFIDKHKVIVYSPFKKDIDALKENYIHKNLPNVFLNKDIIFSNDLEFTINDSDMIIFATPSIFLRENVNKAKEYLNKSQIIIVVSKGLEEGSLFTMSEIINDCLGDGFAIVSLSGPTHAEEVAIKLPTLIVASSSNLNAAKIVQQELSLPYFRVYVNEDIKGAEIAGALKNIIALASGISDGLGYGDNAKAAIITRGLKEITRLGLKLGSKEATFAGLTGIGDIVVTSTSKHSRNYNAGYLIGQDFSLNETLEKIGMVVEGINCLKAAKELSTKVGVEMPIVNAIYSVIFEKVHPIEAVNSLFSRDLKAE